MKKIIAMLLVLTMALSLVACGGGSGDAGAKAVVYWSMWKSTELQGQAIAAAVESFSKETGIKENVLKLCGGSISADEFVANMLAAAGK